MEAARRSAAPPREARRSRRPAALGGRPRPGHRSAGLPDPARIVEILSHELRSPITTINLGTKVLLGAGHGISGPVRAEVVAAVEAEAERLYRLVEDLLAVARHDDATLALAVRPLMLQRWLPKAVGAEVHGDRVLKVRLAIPPDLPPVLADDGALAQVMRNLLRNASLHAADGMPVEVVAREPEDGFVTLELLDRGPGVDPREADRLFEPFYRSPAAEASGSGAGLGLAAAWRLLRAMGGDIAASPREGGGARFTIRLAIAREDEDPAEQADQGAVAATIPRATAEAPTTRSGGTRRARRPAKPSAATATADGDVSPPVATGDTSAAARIPTTTALVPARAAATEGRSRRRRRTGSAARTRSAPGRKMASVAVTAPATPAGPDEEIAPR